MHSLNWQYRLERKHDSKRRSKVSFNLGWHGTYYHTIGLINMVVNTMATLEGQALIADKLWK